VLRQRLSAGHVRDAGIVLCEGCVSSRFEDVVWLRVGRPCAHVAVRHAHDERGAAVAGQRVLSRWQQATSALSAAAP